MHLIKKIALMVGTGTVALVLAACYGMPYNMAYRKVVTKTVANQPIPGLKVAFEGNVSGMSYELLTDGQGIAELQMAATDTGTITITDVDGVDNLGAFASQSLGVGDTEELAVTMEEAN